MWWFAASLRQGGCEGPHPHLLPSTMSRSSTYNRTPGPVRGTRRFSNVVSSPDGLSCSDVGCLTRCHPGFVSDSCHFFGTPLTILGDISDRSGMRTKPV